MKVIYLLGTFLLCLTPGLSAPPQSPVARGVKHAHTASPGGQRPLQLTATILDEKYCVGDDELDSLRLELGLTYTNVGDTPVILYKGAGLLTRVMVSRTYEDASAGSYDVNSRLTTVTAGGVPRFECSRPDDSFVVIPPGSLYSTKTHATLFAVRRDARDIAGAIKSGLSFLQVKVSTWGGPREQALRLRDCWRRSGSLWHEPLTSAPIPFEVKRSRKVSECP